MQAAPGNRGQTMDKPWNDPDMSWNSLELSWKDSKKVWTGTLQNCISAKRRTKQHYGRREFRGKIRADVRGWSVRIIIISGSQLCPKLGSLTTNLGPWCETRSFTNDLPNLGFWNFRV